MIALVFLNIRIVCVSKYRLCFRNSLVRGSLWLHGQAVKTSPFHGGNTGSIPVGVSIHYADVAQLAEQLICNQQVIGSSPIIGFIYGPLAQLVRATGS